MFNEEIVNICSKYVLQRRATEKKTQKEADKQLVAVATRQEEALTEKELELERKAK